MLNAVQAGRARPPVVEPPAVVAARATAKAAAEEVKAPAADRPAPNRAGVIIMPSQRCTAQTKRGGHCKQRTAKGQYCWNHLRSIAGLRIMKTTGRGFGLFAARDLPGKKRINYTGDRVPLESERDGGAYFLQLSQREAIDAARTNCGEGRWVNDPRGTGKRANAEFVLYTPPGGRRIACVRTLRPIKKGEEILVSYGKQYWRYQGQVAERPTRRPHARMQPPALEEAQVAEITATTITSELTAVIRTAAAADATYQQLVKQPPPTAVVREGLVYQGDRLMVPADRALRTRLLAECHDTPTGAHFGRDKLLSTMQARFIWTGLATDAEQYVATCDACQRNKPSQQLTPGLLMPIPVPG